MERVKEQVNEILKPIIHELGRLGYLPVQNQEVFKNHLTYHFGEKFYKQTFLSFNSVIPVISEIFKNKISSNSLLELQYLIPISQFFIDKKRQRLYEGEIPKRILFEFIKACFFCKPIDANITNLIFLLKKISFKKEWIWAIKAAHTTGNLYKPYFNLFDLYAKTIDLNNRKFDQSLYNSRFIDEVFIHRLDLGKYNSESDKLQLLTFPLIDFNDEGLESLILTSNWKGLNRLFAPDITSEDKRLFKGVKNKKELLDMFKRGLLNELIPFLLVHENIKQDVLFISGWNSLFKREKILGILSFEEKEIKQNKLLKDLLDLINKIEG